MLTPSGVITAREGATLMPVADTATPADYSCKVKSWTGIQALVTQDTTTHDIQYLVSCALVVLRRATTE